MPRFLCAESLGEPLVDADRQLTGFAGPGVASSSSSFVVGLARPRWLRHRSQPGDSKDVYIISSARRPSDLDSSSHSLIRSTVNS